jgi:putative acetyltransferase
VVLRRFASADRRSVLRLVSEVFRPSDAPSAMPPEAHLVAALLDAGDVVRPATLVAEAEGRLVGHVACSRATVGPHAVIALGPIGVLPDHRRHGVGSALMHASLAASDALDAPLVALLGSTVFYRRFGFVPASGLGIEAPDPSWADEFQVRTLHAYDAGITGAFRYAPAFAAVGGGSD